MKLIEQRTKEIGLEKEKDTEEEPVIKDVDHDPMPVKFAYDT
jgi:hypothetical protein